MREGLCWDDYLARQRPYPPHRPGRPYYLSGVQSPLTTRLSLEGADIGLMVQPRSGLETWSLMYRFWAADNGCFAQGDRFDADAWLAWLDGLTRDRCLFAVAPDVFDRAAGKGDPDATWARSEPFLERLRDMGFPVGLALQDGAEGHQATWDEADRWDAAFIAGSDDWKLSNEARDVASAAALLGKWCHVGRVNSWRRIDRLADWPVDSVDGTFLKHVPPGDRQLAGWLERLACHPRMALDYVPLETEDDPCRLDYKEMPSWVMP